MFFRAPGMIQWGKLPGEIFASHWHSLLTQRSRNFLRCGMRWVVTETYFQTRPKVGGQQECSTQIEPGLRSSATGYVDLSFAFLPTSGCGPAS